MCSSDLWGKDEGIGFLSWSGDDGRHWLLMRRTLTTPREKAYSFVFAPQGTTLQEMVEANGARWHIEEDFANAKDLGLDHYEVVRRESRASNCSR